MVQEVVADGADDVGGAGNVPGGAGVGAVSLEGILLWVLRRSGCSVRRLVHTLRDVEYAHVEITLQLYSRVALE